ncbi:MAG: FtsX-like permease family protein [Balneolaceae bacterium]
MKMLFSISWRNIWRHPARSGVLLGAIIAGLWAGIMASALTNGMLQQRFDNVILEELTHVQIHHPEFLTEREPWMVLEQTDELYTYLEQDERVRSYTGRTLSGAMIQSPLTSSGVQARGVDTVREQETTLFHENVTRGEYLDSDLRNPILLGESLADKLNSEIGQRVVLTFQDLDNEIISGSFTVAGLFNTSSNPYDERNVFVRNEDLGSLITDRAVIHEIAILLHDQTMSERVAGDLNREFEEISAETWYELSPELRYMTDMSQSMTFYIMVIIMLALAFGILNTMLMAIFERMRELGMLLAIGMNKLRVFTMIMLESVILTLTGAAAGLLIAWLSVQYLGTVGFDFSGVGGDSMAEFGYDAIVYPMAGREDYILTILLVVLTAILAAIYPAIKALKLNPADIVRD